VGQCAGNIDPGNHAFVFIIMLVAMTTAATSMWRSWQVTLNALAQYNLFWTNVYKCY